MTSSNSRKISVTKYFIPTPKKPSYMTSIAQMAFGGFLVLGGIATSLMGLGDNSSYLCCGIPVLLGGIFVAFLGFLSYYNAQSQYKKAYQKAEPKPSDEQMNKWLAQDKKQIVADAMDKLGLVPEQVLNANDPLVVIGPLSSARFRIGNDGTIRFSSYEIVVIYLTDYHLGAYSCEWDFVNARIISEQTQEYHYTDVVSVSTLNSSSDFSVITPDGKEHPVKRHQQFTLSVASGESIKITVAFPQVETLFQKGKLLPTGADRAINVLRTMLREKKGGTR